MGALATTRLLASLLFQVSATEPAALVVAAPVLTAVATLVVWIPSPRASRVAPSYALRAE